MVTFLLSLSTTRFILLLSSIRLLWHTFSPVDMSGDESYYWLWGQNLDWGYYSKPPFIGWLMGVLDWIPLPSTWVIKATATLFSAGSLYYLHKCILTVTQNASLARLGLLAYACSPANLLFSSILTIDSPLMLFWIGGMYYSARLLLSHSPPKPSDYILLTLFLGCGHLCKQMMLIQVVLILLGAIIFRRPLLRVPLFWVALIGSFLFLAPSIWWNAENNWITFQHTGHHFKSHSPTLIKSLQRLTELLLSLAGLVSPILFFLLFPALTDATKRFPKNLKTSSHQAQVFFYLFGGIGLIVMFLLTFRQRVNANWPAVYLIGGLGLILLWCNQSTQRQKYLKSGIQLSAFLSLILMIVLPLLDPLATPLAKIGLKPQRRGWQGYPTLVKQTYDILPPNLEQIAFVGHRFTASQFAFHGKQLSKKNYTLKSVHLWNNSSQIRNQFDFFSPPKLKSPIAIIVEQKKKHSSHTLPAGLKSKVTKLEKLHALPIHHAREYPKFHIYLANSLLEWTDSVKPSQP